MVHEAADAPGDPWAAHRSGMPNKPAAVFLYAGRKLHNDACVALGILRNCHSRIIRGMFRKHGETALQPPGERMGPEDAFIRGRQESNQRIPASHMSRLVS
jgi:hypothetical protein